MKENNCLQTGLLKVEEGIHNILVWVIIKSLRVILGARVSFEKTTSF